MASVRGEATRLRALHAKLSQRIRADENVVYLGNILGHGDAVGDAVEELLSFRRAHLARPGGEFRSIVYLRGSQEEMWQKLLQIQFATDPREVLQWMLDRGVGATLEAYGGSADEGMVAAMKGPVALTEWTGNLRDAMRARDGHNALMSASCHAARTEDGTFLFVHAGVDTERSLAQQTDNFWWGAGGFEEITAPYGGFSKLVRGFDRRHPGIEAAAFTATVDGGCGFGGPLLAACFDGDGELVDTLDT
ncbi:MAG: hypothetical protein QF450_06645 [Rhodospirillales bacterium]|nr:hypothetical protein [Rhodospirillales bacterium]